MNIKTLTLVAGGFLLLFSTAATQAQEDAKDTDDTFEKYRSMFQPIPTIPPIPADNSLTPERIALGEKLYWDRRTSKTGATSCGFCHHPAYYGAEPMDRSVGVFGELHAANAHTVLNAAFHSSQFFNGSAATLEDQALGAIRSHVASRSWPEEDGEPLSEENIGKAIASFMRTLITPDYPLARWLQGDEQAMSEQQKRGMASFVDKGCAACHTSPYFSNFSFQKFEIEGGMHHEGRYKVTENEDDKFRYKVPSLLNVAMTPPYTHAGVVKTLPEMVQVMGKKMLNTELDDNEIEDITAFLHALTGKMPEDFMTIPVLPIGGGEGDFGPELTPSGKE